MATQCPVCQQPVDPATAPTSTYQGVTYYLRCERCKERFDADPEYFLTHQEDNAQRKDWGLRPLERL